MNVTLRQPMTIEQFLAWEDRQELRYEFDGFQPVAMTGGTVAHSTIQVNLIAALSGRLQGTPCRPHGSHMKIEVVGRIRYPDAFVVCVPVLSHSKVITKPVVVFEILSEGSLNEDLVVKNGEYRATPSIQRYIILQQTDAGAIVFARKGEDWVSELISGTDAVIRMPEIGTEIPLANLYIGIDLKTEPDAVDA